MTSKIFERKRRSTTVIIIFTNNLKEDFNPRTPWTYIRDILVLRPYGGAS